jgi:hypothetical protein
MFCFSNPLKKVMWVDGHVSIKIFSENMLCVYCRNAKYCCHLTTKFLKNLHYLIILKCEKKIKPFGTQPIVLRYNRNEKGFWEGEDESNIKLEITCDKMPPNRKVSKMLNGLGGDM